MSELKKLTEKQKQASMKFQDNLQNYINALAVWRYGEKLADLAVMHLSEAMRKSPGWQEASEYILARKGQSRSWNIAAEMFEIYLRRLDQWAVKNVPETRDAKADGLEKSTSS